MRVGYLRAVFVPVTFEAAFEAAFEEELPMLPSLEELVGLILLYSGGVFNMLVTVLSYS